MSQDNISINVNETVENIVINPSISTDTIDFNVYPINETINISVTPELTTVNVNQVSGQVTSVNGQIGAVVIPTSDNNFTTVLKNKLDGIQSGAEVNVNADWNAVSGDAQILNKPTIPSPFTVDATPTDGSSNAVSSNGVFDALATKQNILPALTNGSVLFSNGTTIAQHNANLFWDDTNNRLGIGTNAPTVPLDVNGRVFISTGTEGSSIAPLVVKNTISYQSPFTQFIQIWQNNINQNILTLRTDGNLTLAGSNSTYNSSFFLSNNNGNGTSLLTFARGNNGFWFPSGNSLGINTNGAEKIRVLSTGEVTIGATTAGARLDVRSQGALSTDIAFRVRNSADTANLIQVAGNGAVTFNAAIIATDQVRIGSSPAAASSILDVQSTTKGFLPPRMTNAQRLAIASPAIALMVYCTDTVEGLYINKSTGWQFIV